MPIGAFRRFIAGVSGGNLWCLGGARGVISELTSLAKTFPRLSGLGPKLHSVPLTVPYAQGLQGSVRVIGSNSRCVKADIIPQHLPSADLANVRSVDEACSVSTMNRTRPKQEQSTSLQPCVAGCGGGGKRSDVK